jgi:hypothetical protein
VGLSWLIGFLLKAMPNPAPRAMNMGRRVIGSPLLEIPDTPPTLTGSAEEMNQGFGGAGEGHNSVQHPATISR